MSIPPSAARVAMDCRDAKSVETALQGSKPDVIVNCMAISSPVACEKDPKLAEGVNGARVFIDAVKKLCPEATFIHLSTDQVYPGDASSGKLKTEGSTLGPCNAYGKTKRLGEQAVAELKNSIILRSSGIYGPRPPRVCAKKGTFLQFVLGELRGAKKSIFFSEEKRSHIYVDDCVEAVLFFAEKGAAVGGGDRVFCMGGNGTWARDAYARVVAKVMDISDDNVLPMTRAECKEPWAHKCKQPADISMDSSRLFTLLKRKNKTLAEGVKELLSAGKVE